MWVCCPTTDKSEAPEISCLLRVSLGVCTRWLGVVRGRGGGHGCESLGSWVLGQEVRVRVLWVLPATFGWVSISLSDSRCWNSYVVGAQNFGVRIPLSSSYIMTSEQALSVLGSRGIAGRLYVERALQLAYLSHLLHTGRFIGCSLVELGCVFLERYLFVHFPIEHCHYNTHLRHLNPRTAEGMGCSLFPLRSQNASSSRCPERRAITGRCLLFLSSRDI